MSRRTSKLFTVLAACLVSLLCHAGEPLVRTSTASPPQISVPNISEKPDLKKFLEDQCSPSMPERIRIQSFGSVEGTCTKSEGEGNEKKCSEIKSIVLVLPDGDKSCKVSWQHQRYKVDTRQKPRLTWQLVDATLAQGHRFATIDVDDIDGISMCPRSYNIERFDVAQGECSSATNQSCVTYTWQARNTRPRTRYGDNKPPYDGITHGNLAAAALHSGIVVLDSDGMPCRSDDPIIITSGN